MLRIVGLHTSTENSNIDNFSKQPVLAKRVVTTIYNLKLFFAKEKMLILGYVVQRTRHLPGIGLRLLPRFDEFFFNEF